MHFTCKKPFRIRILTLDDYKEKEKKNGHLHKAISELADAKQRPCPQILAKFTKTFTAYLSRERERETIVENYSHPIQ